MRKYFFSHPPRCLNGFQTAPADLPGRIFDGHGETLNPIFQIKCSCGHAQARIDGYKWANPDFGNEEVFLSPITYTCDQCGCSQQIIDTDEHGYDAELDHGSCTARGMGVQDLFRCPECSNECIQVFIRFEYPDDLFDDDFEDFKCRQQDLFTWVSLHAQCSKCSKTLNITEFECA